MFETLFNIIPELFWRYPLELLGRHSLRVKRMFSAISGNASVLIYTGMLWNVSSTFLITFLPLFMAEQGLSKVEIGTLTSVNIIAQVLGSLLGGWLPERLGLKRAIMLTDILIWPAIYACYGFAHGYFLFFIGSFLSGFQAICWPAYFSLVLKGSPKRHSPIYFGLMQVTWIGTSLFVSLSGIFIKIWGVSWTTRWIMGIGFVLMLIGWFMRLSMVKDTSVPRKPRPLIESLKEVGLTNLKAVKTLWSRMDLKVFMLVHIFAGTAFAVGGTYLNLFITDSQGLVIRPEYLSLLMAVSSATTILSFFLVVPFITGRSLLGYLFLSVVLMGLSDALLLITPIGALGVVIVSFVIGSFGGGIYNSAANGYWASLMTNQERPRMLALTQILASLISFPTPILGGYLYGIHPSAPVVYTASCMAAILVVLVWVGKMAQKPQWFNFKFKW